ncbi:MAG: adenosylcobalamin-dependent ribonucleoside-diphosphate reductase [Desulfosudaceae bacterium]
MTLTPLAEIVLKKRYLARNYRGDLLETPADLFRRVAHSIAEADRLFDARAAVGKTTEEFEAVLSSLSFLPNSPCLMHAGRPMGQLAACFVLPVEDSLEAIFESLKDAAVIHQTAGGTGFSFSRLRPGGDTILPAAGAAGGPIPFIRLFDTATHIIDRNRIRPGANMGVLHVSHPDIESFVRVKQTPGQLVNFNLSVAVDELFLEQVRDDGSYDLIHPRTGVAVDQKPARQLLRLMADCAWKTGDPGIIFIDRLNRANPTPGLGRLEATNPCGEQPLLPYESCTLGSINLTRVLDAQGVDFDKLDRLVSTAVHFLDNVIEVNRYPLRRIEEWSRANRKIGLGVMGFADMLILLNIPYQSQEAVTLAGEIMSRIQASAAVASAELAEKRSNFPAFDHSVFPARGVKYRRNATLTTIAPTGSISLIAGVSSGIEPVFAFNLKRRIADEVHDEVHPLYKRYQQEGREISPEIFQTAWDVDPEWHLKIQAAFQEHTDNAVSKTVNVPESADADTIYRLFRSAAEMNIKGVTVYRDQSLTDQTLSLCSVNREDCG